MMKYAMALALVSGPVSAEAIVKSYNGSFDDAVFSVESSILDRGFVIDHVSHVGEMLERTRQDVGGTDQIFVAADVFLFCSARLSREVMQADPMNIVHCPYTIFVAETEADGVVIGHRDYPGGPMDLIESLLEEIVAEAIEE